MLAAGVRDVSLVDWTSFELMRRLGVAEAFAFDDDSLGRVHAAAGGSVIGSTTLTTFSR